MPYNDIVKRVSGCVLYEKKNLDTAESYGHVGTDYNNIVLKNSIAMYTIICRIIVLFTKRHINTAIL